MMKRFLSWRIRTHMIILLVLAALPCIALIVYSGVHDRNEAIEDAKRDCLGLVNALANEQQNIVAGAQQLGAALSLLPDVQSGNSESVSALFAGLLKMNHQFGNISLADPAGIVQATATPLREKVSVADRRSFREAMRTGVFSSGEYGVGRMAKKAVMSFGQPVKNRYGETVAVIGISLDLEYAQQIFEKVNLPAGASFSMLDHEGVILIRNLKDSFSQKLVGSRDIRQDNFTPAKEGPDEGTFEAMGNDGRFRLVAYKRITLPQESKPYLYVRSSIPLASVTSKAYAAMTKELGLLVLVFGAALCLAWLLGKKAIMNPILLLKKASEQLGAGTTGTLNISEVVKGGEIGELARTFDGMAEALVQREAALRESEQRWATTLASIGDAVIATDTEGRITFMNTVAQDLTGWKLSEALTRPVPEIFNIVNEQTRGVVESPVSKVLREGMIVGLANHTILVRKNGTEIPIDDSGAPIMDVDGKTTGVVLVFRDISERKADEERARRLASFPELIPSPILEVGLSGDITFCNPAAERTLGDLDITKEDCGCFLPADMNAILGNWDGASESVLEREISIKDRIFLETITLVPQFNVARIYTRDITERRRALEALQSTLERFYTILSNMYSAVLLVTEDGAVEFANQTFCDYFNLEEPPERLKGLTAREMIEKILSAYLHSEEAIARIKEIVEEGKPVKGEEVAMANGRTCLRDFIPVYVDGKSHGRAWYHLDITERKRVEEDLVRAKEEWDRTFASVPDMIAIIDNNHRILRVNPAMAGRIGSRLEECVGLHCYEAVHGLSAPPDYCPHSQTLEDGLQHIGAVHEGRLGGYFEVSTTPIYDDQGKMIGSVHVAHDITDRIRAEEVLRTSRDELEKRVQERTEELQQAYDKLRLESMEREQIEEQLRQAQKMEAIGTLAGGIAHDFNNILASVIGFTEMAIDDTSDRPEVERTLKNVLKSGLRARELVKQILAFSRKANFERKPLSLAPVIRETVQLLRASIPATIEINLSLRSISDTVLASPVEVQQVLMNLATNASLAMQERGGVLDVSLTDIDSPLPEQDAVPGEYVQMTVKDTGSGMSPEVMKRVFEPFFTTREVGKGTGMGLAVVYGIVKDLQGTITVESAPGLGSTFRVLLPKVTTDIEADSVRASQIPGGKERILFVDDEEMLVEWGGATLQRLGYRVTALTDSTEALRAFSTNPFLYDLVITDQAMPRLAGTHLVAEILRIRKDIPVILCTGHSETVSPEKAKGLGIREFLMKPTTRQELAEAVRRGLDGKADS
jgi:PAS domain S-box-containing protein